MENTSKTTARQDCRSKHKFPYEWTLKDATFTKDKGTVFSCFSCGGDKLAGFSIYEQWLKGGVK